MLPKKNARIKLLIIKPQNSFLTSLAFKNFKRQRQKIKEIASESKITLGVLKPANNNSDFDGNFPEIKVWVYSLGG